METSQREQSSFRARFGTWAIVTGASDGIGEALARGLAARGLSLVLVARREERLRALAKELGERYGVECRCLALDLASAEAEAVLERETAALEVGLLVPAAGFGTSGPLLASSLRAEQEMLLVNCGAVLAQCHHFGARFARQGRGGIVLLSSLLAFQGVPRAAHYAATKAWVQSLAEGLEGELGPSGVAVLACAPGPVRSGFAARARMTMGLAVTPAVVAEQTLDALGRRSLVRPGWWSKFLEYSLALLPRWARVRALARVMAGMTAEAPALPPEARAA